MKTTKYRISNVLAWVGFTIAPTAIVMILALPPAIIAELLLTKNNPPQDCTECRVLTQIDINGSLTLQSYNAAPGDWVLENEFNRIQPEWVYIAKYILEDISDLYGDEDNLALHWMLWLLLGLSNYIMVGSFRIRPWLHVPDFEDSKR